MPQLFVAMPLKSKEVPGVKCQIMNSAAREGVRYIFPDEMEDNGRITNAIFDEIRRSDVVIAEMTHQNPNVMLEYGYAMAIGKTVIPITQNADNLPFDVRDDRAIVYDPEKMDITLGQILRIRLDKYFKSKHQIPPVQLVGTPGYEQTSGVLGLHSIGGSKFGIVDLIRSANSRVVMAAQNHHFALSREPLFRETLEAFLSKGGNRQFDVMMCDPDHPAGVEAWATANPPISTVDYHKQLVDALDAFRKIKLELGSEFGSRFRIFRLPLIPTSINFVDPEDKNNGLAVITANGLASRSQGRPSFVISKAADNAMFEYYWQNYEYCTLLPSTPRD